VKNKKIFIIGILLLTVLLIFTGCSVRKNVKIKEVKEFTKSVLESNDKIKKLDFYFVRPYLGSHLVSDGDLDKGDLQSIKEEFKSLIDIEFMQRIGDKYWGGSRPSRFNLYIYIDTMDNKKEGHYDYKISSEYNKTHIHDEEADNIDGYQTWFISDNNGVLINEVEEETADTWGIQLSASNITPTGIILVCNQLGGKPTGDLQTGSYYIIETYNGSDWLPVDFKDKSLNIGWTLEAWIIPKDDTVEWEVDWEWLYGNLPEGKYRIGKEIMDFRDTGDYDVKTYYADFEITN
jgi:hypothetical protein